ncbi:hypothetical protein FMEAI12_3350010 [Parafrankia sp. Ea1.12]|nr:hypothetical protein FMEAI12_3350010 [Parafrankia sp. Ea1.12]
MSDQTSTFMVPHLTATQPAAARALPGHRRKGPAVLGGYLAGNMGKDQRRQVCGIVFRSGPALLSAGWDSSSQSKRRNISAVVQ